MRCALGWVAHTGWAAAVAVGGGSSPRLLERRRVELVEGGLGKAAVFHRGIHFDLPVAAVERNLNAVRAEAERSARASIRELTAVLRKAGHDPVGCAIVGSDRPMLLDDVAAILKSHALIHAAEGDLYRQALAAGAEAAGLRLLMVRARDLDTAGPALAAMGRDAGPPWSKDYKLGALAALRLL